MTVTLKYSAEIFKALGDETRLKILKLLLQSHNNLCVGMIAQKLGISQPAVSQHLKVLKNVGIVDPDREGFHVHYKVVNDSLKESGIDLSGIIGKIDIDTIKIRECEMKGIKDQCDEIN